MLSVSVLDWSDSELLAFPFTVHVGNELEEIKEKRNSHLHETCSEIEL